MSGSERPAMSLHEDTARFHASVNFTAAETAFAARLIEKDYFCTLLLSYLSRVEPALVFKGGTCLAKVHAGFYRLSEDLDFDIPMGAAAGRSERSRNVAALKGALTEMARSLPIFEVASPLKGTNNSTQYVAAVRYASPFQPRPEMIKVEIALREPLLTPAVVGVAHTLLLDPVSNRNLVPGIHLPCMSWPEAMAEKLRAALTRREVAIRDFYDIDFAVRRLGLQPLRDDFIELVRAKLAVAGNEPADMSPNRLASLRAQVQPQLRPVLRTQDFKAFDLHRAVATVAEVARRVDGV